MMSLMLSLKGFGCHYVHESRAKNTSKNQTSKERFIRVTRNSSLLKWIGTPRSNTTQHNQLHNKLDMVCNFFCCVLLLHGCHTPQFSSRIQNSTAFLYPFTRLVRVHKYQLDIPLIGYKVGSADLACWLGSALLIMKVHGEFGRSGTARALQKWFSCWSATGTNKALGGCMQGSGEQCMLALEFRTRQTLRDCFASWWYWTQT